MPVMPQIQPISVRRYGLTRLYDATHLRYMTVDRLRRWAAEGVVFSIIDAETGVNVTSVFPA